MTWCWCTIIGNDSWKNSLSNLLQNLTNMCASKISTVHIISLLCCCCFDNTVSHTRTKKNRIEIEDIVCAKANKQKQWNRNKIVMRIYFDTNRIRNGMPLRTVCVIWFYQCSTFVCNVSINANWMSILMILLFVNIYIYIVVLLLDAV